MNPTKSPMAYIFSSAASFMVFISKATFSHIMSDTFPSEDPAASPSTFITYIAHVKSVMFVMPSITFVFDLNISFNPKNDVFLKIFAFFSR